MKVGVLSSIMRENTFEEALEYFSSVGFEMITYGSGGLEHRPDEHCNAEFLLNHPEELKKFAELIEKYHMKTSIIACPSNPVHPQKSVREKMDKDLRDCILLAEQLGVDRVSTFSGCPGDNPNAVYPNWISYCWPHEFRHVLKWQWEKELIPYWRGLVAFAKAHGVQKIALEFHPNMCVYNTETLLRLRDEVGPELGVCLDVSHLFWMGMDPIVVIDKLKDCIWSVHGKDTNMRAHKIKENGVIDAKYFDREKERSWNFTIPGYGHDLQTWKEIVLALRMAGYDRDICFEHEDRLMGLYEGCEKAYAFLKQAMQETEEDKCGMRWRKSMNTGINYEYLK